LRRPAFEALQKAIFAGEIGTVVVYKIDRLIRKLRDGIDTLCNWCEKGLRIVAVTQQIDFSGTVGKILAAVLLEVAEMEQETRREHQAVGLEVAKRKVSIEAARQGQRRRSPTVLLDYGRKA
jgi:DNA invertase Pin-like site-specific DNA recombinase